MIFTFICFLTSMIFWTAFALFWRLLFSSRAHSTSLSRPSLLHEKAIHSFSTLVGLLLAPALILVVATLNTLITTELIDSKLVFIFLAVLFASSHFMARAARNFF